MTRDEIVQLVRDGLGYNNALNEAIVLRAMDLVQTRYERGHDLMPLPWFNLEIDYELTTVASTRTVALPDDFVSFAEEWKPYLQSSDGTSYELARRSATLLNSIRDETGRPAYFETNHANLYLFPLPDDEYSIYVSYYKTSTKFSATTSSNWYTNFPSLLVEETIYQLARNSHNTKALQNSMLKEERANYLVKCEEQKHIIKQVKVGGYGA